MIFNNRLKALGHPPLVRLNRMVTSGMAENMRKADPKAYVPQQFVNSATPLFA